MSETERSQQHVLCTAASGGGVYNSRTEAVVVITSVWRGCTGGDLAFSDGQWSAHCQEWPVAAGQCPGGLEPG